MTIRIVSLKTVVQPDDLLNTKPLLEAFLDRLSVVGRIAVWIQEALFCGEKGTHSIGIEGATLQNEIVGNAWSVGHATGRNGNDIILVPRPVFSTPTVEDEIMGNPTWFSGIPAQHENRSAITNPCVIARDGQNLKIGRLDFSLFQSLLNDVGGFAVLGQQKNFFAGNQSPNNFQISFLDWFKQPGPSFRIMGPSEESGLMLFPLGREAVRRPVDFRSGGDFTQERRKRWSRPA